MTLTDADVKKAEKRMQARVQAQPRAASHRGRSRRERRRHGRSRWLACDFLYPEAFIGNRTPSRLSPRNCERSQDSFLS